MTTDYENQHRFDDTISVVIPVLNAGKYLPTLLPAIFSQRPVAPGEVILVDSASTDNTREVAATFDRVRVIPAGAFSHGRARNLGVREAKGTFVILMTQDALPVGDDWLRPLLASFEDPQVAAVYSRQVPYENATPMERFFLSVHFPDGNLTLRSKMKRRDIQFTDAFFSNVSAAYRKAPLLECPFDETLIMSEDQQVSRDLLNHGYLVGYQPTSVVLHSHRYSLGSIFSRYFDSVYSIMQIFPDHGIKESSSIGLSYLWQEAWHIVTTHPLWIPYYIGYVFSRSTGTMAGHCADHLPRSLLRKISMHAYHWSDKGTVS
ncbi:MAG: glycosyltransferase [Kiritimatiellae bacterium]|nr:glycosyltransferase [Kiritimatiellia bacterium]